MKKYLLMNGPNLNMLGIREPEVYGTTTLATIEEQVVAHGRERGVQVDCFQSNHEGVLVDTIQRVGFDTEDYIGIVLNAGACTHTSLALADAIAAIPLPVVEVHISNVAARAEAIRHTSLIAPVCAGTIAGFGTYSYLLGLLALLKNM